MYGVKKLDFILAQLNLAGPEMCNKFLKSLKYGPYLQNKELIEEVYDIIIDVKNKAREELIKRLIEKAKEKGKEL